MENNQVCLHPHVDFVLLNVWRHMPEVVHCCACIQHSAVDPKQEKEKSDKVGRERC